MHRDIARYINISYLLSIANERNFSSQPASPRTPQHFDISDDDVDEEQPTNTPSYDLTDDRFNLLREKIRQDDIDRLRERYQKTARLGRHLKAQPNDNDAKADHTFYKEFLARKIAELRYDRKALALDIHCLNLFDSIEKDAHISNRMRKKLARYIDYIRKNYPDNE